MSWFRRAAGGLLVALLGALMLAPFAVMLSTSLMDELDVFTTPPPLAPADPRWGNYPAALTALPFGRFFVNSLVFSAGVVVAQLATAATAGYAFARLRFPGRDRLFAVTLALLMVPGVVVLVPRFLLLDALGWTDTLHGLVATELVSVWGIFLLRQAFLGLPRELEDAARLDGAREGDIFLRIALPSVRPALATLALFAFVDAWKNYLWPLVATRSLDRRTMEVGVASFHGFYASNWPFQMAAAVAAALPLVLVFLVARRHFLRGAPLRGFR